MTTQTLFPQPRTAARSRQLVAASERTTIDPFTEIDWSVPIDDEAYHLPPELLPLYGTSVWAAMDETRRREYSRHETSALCGAGIWFENVLMQVVLRHLCELPVTDPAHRYLLIEVADECRHSAMFGEFIRRSGTPAYRPSLTPTSLADADAQGEDAAGRRAVSYLLILAVEELLDYMNRVTMRDERVHVTSRAMARIHVLEEARHMSFAKTYLAETMETLSDAERCMVVETAPILVSVVAEMSVDPAVYEELGIENGAEIARNNPQHRAMIIAGLAKLTGFLTSIGVITEERVPTWVELGVMAPI